MQTIFVIEKLWNKELFERVSARIKRLNIEGDTLEYLGVTWQMIDSEELQVVFTGVRIKTVPRALRFTNNQIRLEDYVANARFESGAYANDLDPHSNATAVVTVHLGPRATPIHKIEINAGSLREANGLYDNIVKREIRPHTR